MTPPTFGSYGDYCKGKEYPAAIAPRALLKQKELEEAMARCEAKEKAEREREEKERAERIARGDSPNAGESPFDSACRAREIEENDAYSEAYKRHRQFEEDRAARLIEVSREISEERRREAEAEKIAQSYLDRWVEEETGAQRAANEAYKAQERIPTPTEIEESKKIPQHDTGVMGFAQAYMNKTRECSQVKERELFEAVDTGAGIIMLPTDSKVSIKPATKDCPCDCCGRNNCTCDHWRIACGSEPCDCHFCKVAIKPCDCEVCVYSREEVGPFSVKGKPSAKQATKPKEPEAIKQETAKPQQTENARKNEKYEVNPYDYYHDLNCDFGYHGCG